MRACVCACVCFSGLSYVRLSLPLLSVTLIFKQIFFFKMHFCLLSFEQEISKPLADCPNRWDTCCLLRNALAGTWLRTEWAFRSRTFDMQGWHHNHWANCLPWWLAFQHLNFQSTHSVYSKTNHTLTTEGINWLQRPNVLARSCLPVTKSTPEFHWTSVFSFPVFSTWPWAELPHNLKNCGPFSWISKAESLA